MKAMNKLLLAFLSFTFTPLAASDPPNLAYWTSQDLKSLSDRLPSQMDEGKRAVEEMARFGTHRVLMVYRESSAPAAAHAHTDFYVIQGGEGTLVLGGEVVDPKPKTPTEVWGTSIRGGKSIKVKAGDMINIPPNAAHQILLDPGQNITYLVINVPIP
jgi:mannose-6-phosphate isomerase-like protein (cupin superfamily)